VTTKPAQSTGGFDEAGLPVVPLALRAATLQERNDRQAHTFQTKCWRIGCCVGNATRDRTPSSLLSLGPLLMRSCYYAALALITRRTKDALAAAKGSRCCHQRLA